MNDAAAPATETAEPPPATCRNCGSTLTAKSVRVEAGAVFINCEFCGTSYQLEEAPKW